MFYIARKRHTYFILFVFLIRNVLSLTVNPSNECSTQVVAIAAGESHSLVVPCTRYINAELQLSNGKLISIPAPNVTCIKKTEKTILSLGLSDKIPTGPLNLTIFCQFVAPTCYSFAIEPSKNQPLPLNTQNYVREICSSNMIRNETQQQNLTNLNQYTSLPTPVFLSKTVNVNEDFNSLVFQSDFPSSVSQNLESAVSTQLTYSNIEPQDSALPMYTDNAYGNTMPMYTDNAPGNAMSSTSPNYISEDLLPSSSPDFEGQNLASNPTRLKGPASIIAQLSRDSISTQVSLLASQTYFPLSSKIAKNSIPLNTVINNQDTQDKNQAAPKSICTCSLI